MSGLRLAAFDFDHTIINPNSDTYIDKILLQDGISGETYFKYPDEVEKLRDLTGWTGRMNGVFDYMHSKHAIDGHRILECLKEIKIDDSMIDLVKRLKRNNYELIILSDANTLFIETILKENNLDSFFDRIYTNGAVINDTDGRLVATPLNVCYNANSEPFRCPTGMCTENICKGTILSDHLKEKRSIDHLMFVGDGKNDYCGGLTLLSNHHFFVRKDHNLEKLFRKKEDLVKEIKATIVYWSSAKDIIDKLAHVF